MGKVTLGSGGEIVLPAALLRALAMQPGDVLTVSPHHEGLLLLPAPKDYVETTYGLARDLWRSQGSSAAFARETEESWRA